MKNYLNISLLSVAATLVLPLAAFAEGSTGGGSGLVAVGSGIAVGLAALGGTMGQGKAVGSGLDAIGRNPSAQGKIFTPMLLGLAFVESLVILAFVIAIQLSGKV